MTLFRTRAGAPQDGTTALYMASMKGHAAVVPLLLAGGADANQAGVVTPIPNPPSFARPPTEAAGTTQTVGKRLQQGWAGRRRMPGSVGWGGGVNTQRRGTLAETV